jgi:hypothetical protein
MNRISQIGGIPVALFAVAVVLGAFTAIAMPFFAAYAVPRWLERYRDKRQCGIGNQVTPPGSARLSSSGNICTDSGTPDGPQHVRVSIFSGWPTWLAQCFRGRSDKKEYVDFEMVTDR